MIGETKAKDARRTHSPLSLSLSEALRQRRFPLHLQRKKERKKDWFPFDASKPHTFFPPPKIIGFFGTCSIYTMGLCLLCFLLEVPVTNSCSISSTAGHHVKNILHNITTEWTSHSVFSTGLTLTLRKWTI